MAVPRATPAIPSGLPTPDEVWSAGDYDRLASYGSPAEAAWLIRFAGVRSGDRVLDVGTGSGIVAIMAAQTGARVVGVDPTPSLLAKAKENAAIAGHEEIGWREASAEALPFDEGSFDVVLSQYAHMFSLRPEAAADEMLRVLAPGGRLAFAAWTPDGLAPRLMLLSLRFLPAVPGPPPPSPFLWGEPDGVRRYLGERVRDLGVEHDALFLPALSPAHARRLFEELFGPTAVLGARARRRSGEARPRATRARPDRVGVLGRWPAALRVPRRAIKV